MAKILYELDSCRQCPYSVSERAYTADSYELVENWYCQEASIFRQYGGNGKLIESYVAWNDLLTVPDDCPVLVRQNQVPETVGNVLSHMVESAKTYIPLANGSIERNSHLHDYEDDANFEDNELSAILTDYINFFAANHCVDYGLNSNAIAPISTNENEDNSEYENLKF